MNAFFPHLYNISSVIGLGETFQHKYLYAFPWWSPASAGYLNQYHLKLTFRTSNQCDLACDHFDYLKFYYYLKRIFEYFPHILYNTLYIHVLIWSHGKKTEKSKLTNFHNFQLSTKLLSVIWMPFFLSCKTVERTKN